MNKLVILWAATVRPAGRRSIRGGFHTVPQCVVLWITDTHSSTLREVNAVTDCFPLSLLGKVGRGCVCPSDACVELFCQIPMLVPKTLELNKKLILHVLTKTGREHCFKNNISFSPYTREAGGINGAGTEDRAVTNALPNKRAPIRSLKTMWRKPWRAGPNWSIIWMEIMMSPWCVWHVLNVPWGLGREKAG